MDPITVVEVSKFAEKQLKKVPRHIREALDAWVRTVHRIGIAETRKLPGFHDEPLKGERQGQRSIRLNRAYRAIYVETQEVLSILVIEVNKHDY